MPSSDRLFWISRWPAPLKLRPMSLFSPPSTPGVVARQAPDVAAVQRQLDDRALADGLRHDGAVGVQHLRRGFDVDRFGDAADLHHGVRADDLVVRDLDAGRFERLEARDASP